MEGEYSAEYLVEPEHTRVATSQLNLISMARPGGSGDLSWRDCALLAGQAFSAYTH
jgi:hypothetical protein